MGIQTATTGQLENAQNIVIAKARYTMEHNQPCVELVEHLSLGKGEKQLTVPKVGQMTAGDLVDGMDLIDTQEIGMATLDLTTGEVGLKVILTDKLVRQENESVLAMVGRQMGDAMARKKDGDIIALFPALNGGTTLGATTKTLTAANVAGCIAFAKANKFPAPVSIVLHPNTVYDITAALGVTPGSTYPLPHGFAEDLLKDFYKITINQVTVFEDGNCALGYGAVAGDSMGAIFSKNAMCVLDQKGFGTERERDASLRATELVVTADYGCWELDDGYGAPMLYDATAPSTTA